jgi:N-methylhydantoinase A
MPLDVEAAREAIRLQIAEPLGLGIDEAAAGIVEIADNNMAGAMRAVSIGRGLDPKDFALVAFGGAGPMHACALASLLGMPSVIVPPTPGVLSTYGLLFTDLRSDAVQTFVHSGSSPSVAEVSEAYARMEKQAREWLDREDVSREAGQVSRSADLRYQHQGWEITVDMPSGPVRSETLEAMVDNFHTLHERLYSYNLPEANVDLVNLRVSATGALPRHEMSRLPDAEGSSPSPDSTRAVMFSRSVGYVDTAIYDRAKLGAGATISGPAIIEQSDTTTLLAPGFGANVDGYGNLVIVGA